MHTFDYSEKVKAMRPSIIRELLKQMSDPTLISFAGGNPAADAFPVEEIRAISDSLLSGPPAAVLQYSITEGHGAMRAQGEKYLNRQWQVMKDTDDIMVTSGSQQVMDFMSKLLCNEGDVIATEEPAFLGALNAFRTNGAKLVGVDTQPDGPNLERLEAVLAATPKPRFFYTIPNFQNPTGFTQSVAKRKAVYGLCKKYGVPILEDNPYGELRFSGEDLPPIKSFDDAGLVVYAASLSKVFAPAMRVALCVGQKEIVAKMAMAKQGNDVHTALWGQRVIEQFFEKHDFGAHITRLRKVYAHKAEKMMAELKTKLDGKASFVPVEGGMFIWLTLPDAVDTHVFVQKCLDRKLALVPGSAFFIDGDSPCHSVRCNFSCPTDAQIDEGTSIMAQVLDEMMK